MLIIRQEQMEKFSQVMIKRFEDLLFEHLKDFSPEKIRALGEAAVRKIIHYGIDRARGYDYFSELHICKYIELMFLLGQDFDKNPDIQWAGQILRDRTLSSAEKINLIHQKVQKDLEESL